MSSNCEFVVSAEDLEKALNRLTGKELMSAQKRSLSKAARIIYKRAQKGASVVPNVRKRSPNYIDTMYQGVRMGVYEENYTWFFKVHVLGTRKKGSKTYMLRFFEGGTVPRKTKSPYTDKLGRRYPAGQNRGQIRPYYFFRTAVSGCESEIVNELEKNMIEEVNKIISNK